MGGSPRSKLKAGPSFEDGKVRDPEIEAKMGADEDGSLLHTLIHRSVQDRPNNSQGRHTGST